MSGICEEKLFDQLHNFFSVLLELGIFQQRVTMMISKLLVYQVLTIHLLFEDLDDFHEEDRVIALVPVSIGDLEIEFLIMELLTIYTIFVSQQLKYLRLPRLVCFSGDHQIMERLDLLDNPLSSNFQLIQS